MNKPYAPLLAVALGAAVTTAAASGLARQHESHQAKVAVTDARAKALSLVPGRIVSEELEKEGGRWIYSFEIKQRGETRKVVQEVNIDADTGAVVGVETEKE